MNLVHTLRAILLSAAISRHSANEYAFTCDEPEICANMGPVTAPFSSLSCSAFASCYNTAAALYCIEEDGCEFSCSADEACAHSSWYVMNASSITCDGYAACEYAGMAAVVRPGTEMLCSDYQACANTILVSGGVTGFYLATSGEYYIEGLSCDGVQSCSYSLFAMDHPEEVTCDGEAACAASGFDIDAPSKGFSFRCHGDEACLAADVEIVFSDDDWTNNTQMASISCEGRDACNEARFQITNNADETVVIDQLLCSGVEACKDLVIEVSANDVVINKCICDEATAPYSCLCAEGLEICLEFDGVWNTTGTAAFSCSSST